MLSPCFCPLSPLALRCPSCPLLDFVRPLNLLPRFCLLSTLLPRRAIVGLLSSSPRCWSLGLTSLPFPPFFFVLPHRSSPLLVFFFLLLPPLPPRLVCFSSSSRRFITPLRASSLAFLASVRPLSLLPFFFYSRVPSPPLASCLFFSLPSAHFL